MLIMLDVLISNSQEYLNMQDVLVIGDSSCKHQISLDHTSHHKEWVKTLSENSAERNTVCAHLSLKQLLEQNFVRSSSMVAISKHSTLNRRSCHSNYYKFELQQDVSLSDMRCIIVTAFLVIYVKKHSPLTF